MHKDATWFFVGTLLALHLPRWVHASAVGPFLCEDGSGGCNGCADRGYAPVTTSDACNALFVNADSGTTMVLTPNGDLPVHQGDYPLGALAQWHPHGCSALYSLSLIHI